jgi:hypothetical protein
MSQHAEFRQLARNVYVSYHQDGLIDLIIGWGTLAYGLNLAFDASAFSLLGLVGIFSYVPLKNRITVPRFGYVKFDSEHGGLGRAVAAFVALFVLVAMLLGIAAFLLSGSSTLPPGLTWIRENPSLLYALLGMIGFGLAGLITGIQRLFIYALLSPFLLVGGQVLGIRESGPILLVGSTILVTGVVLLIRFLRKYPAIAEEESHVTQ